MKKLEMENTEKGSYLTCQLEESEKLDMVALGMITNNSITGICEVQYLQIDNERTLRYDLQQSVSLNRILERALKKNQNLEIVKSIVRTILRVRDYMIPVEALCLDKRYMFWDLEGEIRIICFPLEEGMHTKGEECLLEMLEDWDETCSAVQGSIYQELYYVLKERYRDLEDFLKWLEEREMQILLSNQEARGPIVLNRRKSGGKMSGNPSAYGSGSEKQGKGVTVLSHRDRIREPVGKTNGIKPEILSAQSMEPEVRNFNEKPDKLDRENVSESSPASVQHPKESQQHPEKSLPPKNSADNPVVAEIDRELKNRVEDFPKADKQPAEPQQESSEEPDIVRPLKERKEESSLEEPDIKGKTNFESKEEDLDKTQQFTLMRKSYLFRISTKERIPVDKKVFRIGRKSRNSESYLSYAISQNTMISRKQALIRQKEGDFFLIDTDSMNHVYLNGQMILPNKETKLSNADEIRLADEAFRFWIEDEE